MPSFINSIREELAFRSDYLFTLNLNICQREKRAQIRLKITITHNHTNLISFCPDDCVVIYLVIMHMKCRYVTDLSLYVESINKEY